MRTLSAYVHIPFCATRCGYCDFNTYTSLELQRDGTTVTSSNYAEFLTSEIELTANTSPESRPLHSVFFGGGTPTMIGAAGLTTILDALKATFGLAPNAEVTTEANPDSVTRDDLDRLRQSGFTRLSFGHQSSASHVLQVLERTHTPGKTWQAVQWAHEVGFEHISIDLIYGTPGETDSDIELAMREIGQAPVDHVSAYSLIVEPGTRLAASVARGDIPMPSDDVAAHRYELIDDSLAELGMTWYEVSNWSKPGGECRHNIAYWQNQDWLGFGPGAHAHQDGTRSWTVKHPAAWASRLASSELPVADVEHLSADERHMENVMLSLRLKSGLNLDILDATGQVEAAKAQSEGLLVISQNRAQLTRNGRLLADGLISRLLG